MCPGRELQAVTGRLSSRGFSVQEMRASLVKVCQDQVLVVRVVVYVNPVT